MADTRAPAKKAAPRKAAPPIPSPGVGGAAEWPEDPVAAVLGQILTVQGQQLEVLEKLLETTSRAADLTQAGTAEMVAARVEIRQAVTQLGGLFDAIRPHLPTLLGLLDKAKTLPTTPGGILKSAILGKGGAHRGR